MLFLFSRMAPEVILCETIKDDPYTFKADIWSLGKCSNIPGIFFNEESCLEVPNTYNI